MVGEGGASVLWRRSHYKQTDECIEISLLCCCDGFTGLRGRESSSCSSVSALVPNLEVPRRLIFVVKTISANKHAGMFSNFLTEKRQWALNESHPKEGGCSLSTGPSKVWVPADLYCCILISVSLISLQFSIVPSLCFFLSFFFSGNFPINLPCS